MTDFKRVEIFRVLLAAFFFAAGVYIFLSLDQIWIYGGHTSFIAFAARPTLNFNQIVRPKEVCYKQSFREWKSGKYIVLFETT